MADGGIRDEVLRVLMSAREDWVTVSDIRRAVSARGTAHSKTEIKQCLYKNLLPAGMVETRSLANGKPEWKAVVAALPVDDNHFVTVSQLSEHCENAAVPHMAAHFWLESSDDDSVTSAGADGGAHQESEVPLSPPSRDYHREPELLLEPYDPFGHNSVRGGSPSQAAAAGTGVTADHAVSASGFTVPETVHTPGIDTEDCEETPPTTATIDEPPSTPRHPPVSCGLGFAEVPVDAELSRRYELRPYQQSLVDKILAYELGNSIVALPTGAGKTFIAAEVLRMKSRRSLFLVPTRLLVVQQANALREWFEGKGSPLKVVELAGGVDRVEPFDVLVATPEAFLNLQERSGAQWMPRPLPSQGGVPLNWLSFGMVVFDEVHHTDKDHPYRRIASALDGHNVGLLGLSATLSYSIGESRIEERVRSLSSLLLNAQVLSTNPDDLIAQGHNGHRVKTDSRVEDVPFFIPAGVVDENTRKAKQHAQLDVFLERIKSGVSTAMGRDIFCALRALEGDIIARHPTFTSPLDIKHLTSKKWQSHLKKYHGYDYASKIYILGHWYMALKIMVITWEEGFDAALTYLRMSNCHNVDSPILQGWISENTRGSIQRLFAGVPLEFPRFAYLKKLLTEVLQTYQESFRGILFVQLSVMTYVLEDFVLNDEELSSKFKPTILHGINNSEFSMSKSTAKKNLERFSGNGANLLIATDVAEEGMDIPKANVVIRFDPMNTPVSYFQGRGRARADDSLLVVMRERTDRPVSALLEADRHQHEVIARMTPLSATGNNAASPVPDAVTAFSRLNYLVQRMDTSVQESYVRADLDDEWMCTLTVKKDGQPTYSSQGYSSSKKNAKAVAAIQLLNELQGADRTSGN